MDLMGRQIENTPRFEIYCDIDKIKSEEQVYSVNIVKD